MWNLLVAVLLHSDQWCCMLSSTGPVCPVFCRAPCCRVSSLNYLLHSIVGRRQFCELLRCALNTACSVVHWNWCCFMRWRFDLFVYPLSHTCNIGHVNYRLQFKRVPFGKLSLQFGVCKPELYLVLILSVSEFDSYKSLFLATNNRREKLYCDFNGKIFILLNNWFFLKQEWHKTLDT
jgi:hypothetical protein